MKRKLIFLISLIFFLTFFIGSVKAYNYDDSYGTIEKICSKNNEYILFVIDNGYSPFNAKLSIIYELNDHKDGDLRGSINSIDENNIKYQYSFDFRNGDLGNVVDNFSNVFYGTNYISTSGEYEITLKDIFGKSTILTKIYEIGQFLDDLYDEYYYNGYSDISDKIFNSKQDFTGYFQNKQIVGYIYSNTTGISITNAYLEAYGIPSNSPIILIIISVEVSIITVIGIRRYRKHKR